MPTFWVASGRQPLLSSLVLWLFENCGAVETEARHICMDLVTTILGADGRRFVQQQFDSGMVLTMCESMAVPYPQSGEAGIEVWLSQMEAMLDCYVWLVGQALLDAKVVFNNKLSQLWNAWNHFVLFLSRPSTYQREDMTPQERSSLFMRVGTVGVRAMQLLAISPIAVPQSVFSSDVLRYILTAVLTPNELCFDWSDTAIATSLPAVTLELLMAMRSLPAPILDHCVRICVVVMSSAAPLDKIGPEIFSQPHRYTAFFDGLLQLHSAGLLTRVLAGAGGANPSILLSALATAPLVPPAAQATAHKALELALFYSDPPELLAAIFDLTPIAQLSSLHGDEMEDDSREGRSRTTRGAVFYNGFAPVINRFIAGRFDLFSKPLIDQFQHPHMLILIRGLLASLRADKSLAPLRVPCTRHFVSFFASLAQRWLPPTAALEFRMDALSVLVLLFQIEAPFSGIPEEHSLAVCDFACQLLTDPKVGLDSEGMHACLLLFLVDAFLLFLPILTHSDCHLPPSNIHALLAIP